ncbi:MAG: hypothetical protein J3Q66DRAFT_195001 [Benniella sp.]|nr:MAG: hypothetical protein J3Q66DRAFT_195001 [Benniella sp.]
MVSPSILHFLSCWSPFISTHHPTDTDTCTFTSRPSRETRRKAPRVARHPHSLDPRARPAPSADTTAFPPTTTIKSGSPDAPLAPDTHCRCNGSILRREDYL